MGDSASMGSYVTFYFFNLFWCQICRGYTKTGGTFYLFPAKSENTMSRLSRIRDFEESTGLRYEDGDPTKIRRQAGLVVTVDHEYLIRQAATTEALLAYLFDSFDDYISFTASHWAGLRFYLVEDLSSNDEIQTTLSLIKEEVRELVDSGKTHYHAITMVAEKWVG